MVAMRLMRHSCIAHRSKSSIDNFRRKIVLLLRFRRQIFVRPFFVFLGRMNENPSLHSGMTEAAKLGAGNLVFSRLDRFEPCSNLSAWNRVLLKAHVWHEKTVNDILGRKLKADGLVDGHV